MSLDGKFPDTRKSFRNMIQAIIHPTHELNRDRIVKAMKRFFYSYEDDEEQHKKNVRTNRNIDQMLVFDSHN